MGAESTVVVGDFTRLRQNGETPRLMLHLSDVKASTTCSDTTVDQPWDPDWGLCLADLYAQVLLEGVVVVGMRGGVWGAVYDVPCRSVVSVEA